MSMCAIWRLGCECRRLFVGGRYAGKEESPNQYKHCSKCDVTKQVEFVTLIDDAGLKTTDVRSRIISPSEVQLVERSIRREEKLIAEMKASGISYCDF